MRNLINEMVDNGPELLKPGKSILDWFSPTNTDHLAAYKVLQESGKWPRGFIPEGLEFPENWNASLAQRVAKHFTGCTDTKATATVASEAKVSEQKEIASARDINGEPIIKGDIVSVDGRMERVVRVWDDGCIDIEIVGPGGPSSDTINIKGHNVEKIEVDESEAEGMIAPEDEPENVPPEHEMENEASKLSKWEYLWSYEATYPPEEGKIIITAANQEEADKKAKLRIDKMNQEDKKHYPGGKEEWEAPYRLIGDGEQVKSPFGPSKVIKFDEGKEPQETDPEDVKIKKLTESCFLHPTKRTKFLEKFDNEFWGWVYGAKWRKVRQKSGFTWEDFQFSNPKYGENVEKAIDLYAKFTGISSEKIKKNLIEYDAALKKEGCEGQPPKSPIAAPGSSSSDIGRTGQFGVHDPEIYWPDVRDILDYELKTNPSILKTSDFETTLLDDLKQWRDTDLFVDDEKAEEREELGIDWDEFMHFELSDEDLEKMLKRWLSDKRKGRKAAEGKEPLETDPEDIEIKKLTEQVSEEDYKKQSLLGKKAETDEEKPEEEEEVEESKINEIDKDIPDKPKGDDEVSPDTPEEKPEGEEDFPEPKEEEQEEIELDKAYLGRSADKHLYVITNKGDSGAVEDLLIVDQEGETVMSAKEEGLEVTDVPGFIEHAIQDTAKVKLEYVERGIVLKYVLPKAEEELGIEEPEEEEEEDEFGAEEEIPPEIPEEEPKKPKEEKPKESKTNEAKDETSRKEYLLKKKARLEKDVADIQKKVKDVESDLKRLESTNEAKMGVDYVRTMKTAVKTAVTALKDKDYEAASKALEDVADDAADAAKAAKKMKRDADSKAEKEKETAGGAKESKTDEGKVAEKKLSDKGKLKIALDLLNDEQAEEFEDEVKQAEEEEPPKFGMKPLPKESKIPSDTEPEDAQIKKLTEIKVSDSENTFDVHLVEEGTEATVISINDREFRFGSEFASHWRDKKTGKLAEAGLKELALDALSSLEEDEYQELVGKAEERCKECAKEGGESEMTPEKCEKCEAREGQGLSAEAMTELKNLMFQKEKKEHPDFEKEQVWTVVRDHLVEMGIIEPGDELEDTSKDDEESPLETPEDAAASEEKPTEECAAKESTGVDEKKKPPVCPKCKKAHWPFQKCSAKVSAVKEDVWKLESPEEDEAADYLGDVSQKALEGDEKAQRFLEKIFDEKWISIKPKLEAEGSTYYVWWMDGVRKLLSKRKGRKAAEGKEPLETDLEDVKIKKLTEQGEGELKDMYDVLYTTKDGVAKSTRIMAFSVEDAKKQLLRNASVKSVSSVSKIGETTGDNKKVNTKVNEFILNDEIQLDIDTALDEGKTPSEINAILEAKKDLAPKKPKKGAALRSRGDCVFPANSPKVKDNADHFPINKESQACNAWARANQYDAAPKWYSGSLSSLVSAVKRAVKAKYPSIELGKGTKESIKESEEIDPAVLKAQELLDILPESKVVEQPIKEGDTVQIVRSDTFECLVEEAVVKFVDEKKGIEITGETIPENQKWFDTKQHIIIQL